MGEKLRVVTFNVFQPAYGIVAEWAARHGHRLVLLVTVPGGGGDRYGDEVPGLAAVTPPGQDVLVTTRLRRTAAPVIEALAPDLIVSVTYPLRIPPEVAAIPRYGALNVHPSVLPRWRGPNPQRSIYEGDAMVGATLHRMDPEFDSGPMLSRHELPRPADMTARDLLHLWLELCATVLREGVERAVAGDPGEPQDHRVATYAAPFSEQERWLDWSEPALTVQRRAAALNVAAPTACAVVDGQPVEALEVRALRVSVPPGPPGTLLRRSGDVGTVRVADGAVSVRMRPMPAGAAPPVTAARPVVLPDAEALSV